MRIMLPEGARKAQSRNAEGCGGGLESTPGPEALTLPETAPGRGGWRDGGGGPRAVTRGAGPERGLAPDAPGTSEPHLTCRAAPRSARSPPRVWGSGPLMLVRRCCPCTRPATSAASGIRTGWRRWPGCFSGLRRRLRSGTEISASFHNCPAENFPCFLVFPAVRMSGFALRNLCNCIGGQRLREV
mgnify:CR=1 FL=1